MVILIWSVNQFIQMNKQVILNRSVHSQSAPDELNTCFYSYPVLQQARITSTASSKPNQLNSVREGWSPSYPDNVVRVQAWRVEAGGETPFIEHVEVKELSVLGLEGHGGGADP